jgi:hypothetical protein
MASGNSPKSLLDWLKTVPDPRSRRGRGYPLWGVLAMLMLGALHGEGSLRGMWMWAVKHWPELYERLGLLGNPHAPAYSTVWEVMSRLDVARLEEIVTAWVNSWAAVGSVSIDGKMLRGSARSGEERAALEVVTAAGQDVRVVLGQGLVGAAGELQAAVQLIKSLPLQGKVVTVDAGLLHRELVKAVLEQGGDYVGLIKGNEADVKEMVEDWLDPQLSPPGVGTAGGSCLVG